MAGPLHHLIASPGTGLVACGCKTPSCVGAQRPAASFCHGPGRTQRSATRTHGLGQAVAELFGATLGDPGHWNLSPEWYGTQARPDRHAELCHQARRLWTAALCVRLGGGYGRDAGELVFERQSECGNGRITVTAHAAFPASERAGAGEEQWRVLRFNDATRQSVARVAVRRSAGGAAREGPETGSASSVGLCLEAQPRCLAADYLKTVASAAAAVVGCWPAELRQRCLAAASPDECGSGRQGARAGGPCALCIGVGGGALPLFLAHAFPGLMVEAVELDAAVLEAATAAMGLPTDRRALPHSLTRTGGRSAPLVRRLRRPCWRLPGDGAAWVAGAAARVRKRAEPPLDLVLLDAFDGADAVPACFTQPGGAFLRDLAAALHPVTGALVANLHRADASCPPDVPGPESAARAFRDALLTRGDGAAWLAHAPRQANAAVVAARGAALPRARPARRLEEAARRTGAQAGFPFDAGARAVCRLRMLDEG